VPPRGWTEESIGMRTGFSEFDRWGVGRRINTNNFWSKWTKQTAIYRPLVRTPSIERRGLA